jgi:diguanylate cyclase (GGDEF)-like protein
MAFFISITEARLRRILLVFFILASLFPVIITIFTLFQWVAPILTEAQIDSLRDVFNYSLLSICLIQLMSFLLFWGWVSSWETLKRKIQTVSADILKKKDSDEIGENELFALNRLFQELHDEFNTLNERLESYFHRSVTDERTLLYNRSYFKMKISEEVKRARQYGQDLSMIVFEIEEFHHLSSAKGDHLLKDIGGLTRKTIRQTDLPFRVGRNRFAILLPGCSGSVGGMIARKISDRISNEQFQDSKGRALGAISICCGVSVLTDDMKQFILKAEKNLAKARGEGAGEIVGP